MKSVDKPHPNPSLPQKSGTGDREGTRRFKRIGS
jgi:hypothetical protein